MSLVAEQTTFSPSHSFQKSTCERFHIDLQFVYKHLSTLHPSEKAPFLRDKAEQLALPALSAVLREWQHHRELAGNTGLSHHPTPKPTESESAS